MKSWCCKKIFLAWIVVSITLCVVSFLMWMFLDAGMFADLYKENPALWKDPMLFQYAPIAHIIVAFFFVVIFSQFRPHGCPISKNSRVLQWLFFGILLWLLIYSNGMLMTYFSMPVSPKLLWLWFAEGIVTMAIAWAVAWSVLKCSDDSVGNWWGCCKNKE